MAAGVRWLKGGVVSMVMMIGASQAIAQDHPLPWDDLTGPAAYVSFDVIDSDWTLYPVITEDSDFIGFFGYLPDESVVGNNVSLLWLIPDNGDGSWSMYGWSNTDMKLVSNYLDDLTGTEHVLADTGLDIFGDDTQAIASPKSMPFGIADDDPLAPIMEATQDPTIAGALITVGAAGAPNLTQATNIQPTEGCIALTTEGLNISELDMKLAMASRGVLDMMPIWASNGIMDSIDATGYNQDQEAWCCWPITYTVNGAWSPWSCTGGTPAGTPTTTVGSCTWTGCTRCRPTFVVTVNWNCITGSFAGPIECTTPSTEQRDRHPEADCPSIPSPE